MTQPLAARSLGVFLPAVLLVAAPLAAQEQREPRGAEPDHQVGEEASHAGYEDPPHAFEFTLGADGLGLGYRTGLHRGKGFTSFDVFLSDDDDVALSARLMRFGEPKSDVPFGVGIGLGVFAARIDETNDQAVAITLTGAADYALDRLVGLTYPTRAGVEVSYASDAVTFADGTRVLDLRVRVETDLSTWATAFVGYRQLDVDLADEDDAELDSALHLGVRLGF